MPSRVSVRCPVLGNTVSGTTAPATLLKEERKINGKEGKENNPSPSSPDHFELITGTLKIVVIYATTCFFSMTFMVWGSKNKLLGDSGGLDSLFDVMAQLTLNPSESLHET